MRERERERERRRAYRVLRGKLGERDSLENVSVDGI
jgi:hypothetical protein